MTAAGSRIVCGEIPVGGCAARAAYGGNAARAAAAWEHRAGDTIRPTRQAPAGSQARARLVSASGFQR